MQVQVENVGPVTRKLTVTVPKETVKSKIDDIYKELGKKAQVKGFRKGKAPRAVLEKMYKPRVDADVIQTLVEESYPKAVEEHKLAPVASPVINETTLKDGEDFRYVATVEVKPAFELPTYTGFSIEAKEKPVTDADVTEQLEKLRERKSSLVPMLEDRALVKGDFAVIDYESFVGGSPKADSKTEDAVLEIGTGQLIDEFESGLPGMKPGETRALEITFPPEHADAKLAGKKVLYRVTL